MLSIMHGDLWIDNRLAIESVEQVQRAVFGYLPRSM
ncbi:hypothetical protein WL1483_2007 [Aeromonas schubertii]|uniref:Uncharacterized protein n=1 Tax=Aeromonas schubertii TaxID=652 RepID=A0A0S2SIC1_9GAMM|nr:hypothetical protein WL1483_2007 [Aeromonas schubertii]